MKSNWIGLRGEGSDGYLGAFALNLSMSTVCARKREEVSKREGESNCFSFVVALYFCT